MELSDLKKSLSEMTEAELKEFIVEMRNSRETQKQEAAAKTRAKNKPAKKVNTTAVVKKLSAAQRATLLAELEAELVD